MSAIPNRILVIAHDRALRESRVMLLVHSGYQVVSVATDDEAMDLLESARFDLILLGRNPRLPNKGIDQRLRERYRDLLILKIDQIDPDASPFPSRIVGTLPAGVLTALDEMLTEAAGP